MMQNGLEQAAADTPNGAAYAVAELAAGPGTGPDSNGFTSERPGRAPFGRFRRNLERVRDDGDGAGRGSDDEADLRLELALLREENARLKAARRTPADVGPLIEQLRALAGEDCGEGALDEAWTVLTECLVIREGLERACDEIVAAVGAVQRRLRTLVPQHEPSPDPGAQLAAVAD